MDSLFRKGGAALPIKARILRKIRPVPIAQMKGTIQFSAFEFRSRTNFETMRLIRC